MKRLGIYTLINNIMPRKPVSESVVPKIDVVIENRCSGEQYNCIKNFPYLGQGARPRLVMLKNY